MKKLTISFIKKYCEKEYTIDGVKTYIIPEKHYDRLYHDIETSDMISKKLHLSCINYIKEINIPELYLSIVSLYRDNLQMFVYCYEYAGKLYHISLQTGWVCLECRQPNTFDGIYAIPMYEDDLTFLPLDVIPEIPPVFKKIPCQYCGKFLNRRFFKIKR